jgi:hypothetical protein
VLGCGREPALGAWEKIPWDSLSAGHPRPPAPTVARPSAAGRDGLRNPAIFSGATPASGGPGPLTQRPLKAWGEAIGLEIVGQAEQNARG